MKLTRITAGAAILVVGVIAMTFVAVQLAGGEARAVDPLDSDSGFKPIRVMELAVERVIDKGAGPVSQTAVVRIVTMPASGLPDSSPDVSGISLGLEGATLRVGTGSITADVDVRIHNDEPPVETVTLTHDGPEVEVLLGPDTVVYREETVMPGGNVEELLPKDANVSLESEIVIQQTVARVDSWGDIGESTEIQAWGRKQGNAIVADVLVYRELSELRRN